VVVRPSIAAAVNPLYTFLNKPPAHIGSSVTMRDMVVTCTGSMSHGMVPRGFAMAAIQACSTAGGAILEFSWESSMAPVFMVSAVGLVRVPYVVGCGPHAESVRNTVTEVCTHCLPPTACVLLAKQPSQ
jgi:hypothetical protein